MSITLSAILAAAADVPHRTVHVNRQPGARRAGTVRLPLTPPQSAHLMPSAEGRALKAIEAAFSEDHGPDTAQEAGNLS